MKRYDHQKEGAAMSIKKVLFENDDGSATMWVDAGAEEVDHWIKACESLARAHGHQFKPKNKPLRGRMVRMEFEADVEEKEDG